MTDGLDEPLDPSVLAQFVEHDRCPRYLKQAVEPGDEPDARNWSEAFGLLNLALLGDGKVFEANQVEDLAQDAVLVVAPTPDDDTDPSAPGHPALDIDETWNDRQSARGPAQQIRDAIQTAADLEAADPDTVPYVLLYQPPLSGTVGDHPVSGAADLIALTPADALGSATSAGTTDAPAADDTDADTDDTDARDDAGADAEPSPAAPDEAVPTGEQGQPAVAGEDADPDVVAQVLDCKSAHDEQAAHRVQVAIYCALLEETLVDGGAHDITVHIDGGVVTKDDATTVTTPFEVEGFRQAEWRLFVQELLAEGADVDQVLDDDLAETPFVVDQVCDNCKFREACTVRAVEQVQSQASLGLLGLDPDTQRRLTEAGIDSLAALADVLPRDDQPSPTDEPDVSSVDPDLLTTLEQILPGPVHEYVQRAQALRGEYDPQYPDYTYPPAIKGQGRVPLPDDTHQEWGNLDDAAPGELIHVALIVRPDSTIDRVAALGACVTAAGYDGYETIGDVIDAVPDDDDTSQAVERTLLERFLDALYDTIETVAAEVGDSANAAIHCYTYTDYAEEALLDALDRHLDHGPARAFRDLLSLRADGRHSADQAMCSTVLPVLDEHFALAAPSRDLLAVVEQFDSEWYPEKFDPPSNRPDAPPLRFTFSHKYLNRRLPLANAGDHVRVDLGEGPLADTAPNPYKWAALRKRAGAQFPLEYIWAAVPEQPGDSEPRLTPSVIDEWDLDEDNRAAYEREIEQFRARETDSDARVQREDVSYLMERLAFALTTLVENVPYKDAFMQKESLDATQLDQFSLGERGLPSTLRDYLGLEYGAQRDALEELYRQPLRQRLRTGKSLPVRFTDYTAHDDGSLTIDGELAYEAIIDDVATAEALAQRVRASGSDDDAAGGGSWRLVTPLALADTASDATGADAGDDGDADGGADAAVTDDGAGDESDGDDGTDNAAVDPSVSARDPRTPTTTPSQQTAQSPSAFTEAGVEKPWQIRQSPPVTIDEIDPAAGTVTLTAFPQRFKRNGSRYRCEHRDWICPADETATDAGDDGDDVPAPVPVVEDGLYVLDPMMDDFSAPKADRALKPAAISQNALYQHLQTSQTTGQTPPSGAFPLAPVETLVERVRNTADLIPLTDDQAAFIQAVSRAIVMLQGPPGSGKTSGAIAPALLARAYARSQADDPCVGIVTAPSHTAVDGVLEEVVSQLAAYRDAWDGFLPDTSLVRIVPGDPADTPHADADTSVDVAYCSYTGETEGSELAGVVEEYLAPQHRQTEDAAPGPCLLFVTPTTLYKTLGVAAETLDAIDGDSAPAAMRHTPGLADLLCVDEASMLDLPRLLLAGSVVRTQGQTLLVGDHRQLASVQQHDWDDERRRPVAEQHPQLSALDYLRWVNTGAASQQAIDPSNIRAISNDDSTGGTDADKGSGPDADAADKAGGETDD